MIKGAKSIAEYAIRKWLEVHEFDMNQFDLTMNGNEGTLTDKVGDSIVLAYDTSTRRVYEKR